jgi:hypothetical protein
MSDMDDVVLEAAPTLAPSMAGAAADGGTLVGIRVGQHTTFDRVVFDFADGGPSFLVSHVARLREDGSGNVVPVQGRAVLRVVLSPATAHDGNGAPTVGPLPPVAGFAALRDIVPAGDFEGVVTYGIGTAGRSPFAAGQLTGPPRVVVDVVHIPPGRGNDVLRQGDEGAAVATWQWRLRLVLSRTLAVDEKFGPATDAATRDFQGAQGLAVDGLVGRMTREAMERVLKIS